MDDIQAEIHARHRYMRGADPEDYQTNVGLPTLLPSTRSNSGSLDRRITLSNAAKAAYAPTTSQHPVYRSNASTVPRSLQSIPSTFCDQAGTTISSYFFHVAHTYIDGQLPTQPFNHISGGSSNFNRDLSSIRPYPLPTNPLQDRSWFAKRPTPAFPVANSSFCGPGGVISSNSH